MTVAAPASGSRGAPRPGGDRRSLDRSRVSWLVRLVELPAVLVLVALGRPGSHLSVLLVLLVVAGLGWIAWLVMQPWPAEEVEGGGAIWGLLLVISGASGLATMVPGAGNAAILAGIAALHAGATLRPSRALSVPLAGVVAVVVGAQLFDRSSVWLSTAFYAAVLACAALAGVARGLRLEQLRQARLLLVRERQARDEQQQAAALAERTRIAREIHDILAHSLADLAIQLEVADALLADSGDSSGALPRVRHARRLATAGLEETRRAVHALRSDAPPLPDALAVLVGADASARLEIEGVPRPLPAAVGLALLRTAQEGLVNARKHAVGLPVSLRLRYRHDRVDLTISDGPGPDPHDRPGRVRTAVVAGVDGGYGLVGMRERLRLVGGSLTAGPGLQGWVVRAEVPG